ncbi:MAG: alpha/beta hydrolase [Clostridia bacterium]|nr:alpha/beta hydrolase [Clostridia bacterium]
MKSEVIVLNEERNVTLTAYLQEVGGEFQFAKRPAMLVLPGGGYAMCSDREADPVALSYSRAGYQTFVLRYTVGAACEWPMPLDDYEAAMALIEQNAEAWHVDSARIAVVGFSAGGHLAACTATVAKHKPAAAILVYAAILPSIVDLCKPNMPYPNEHVDAETCPCFLVAARDDRLVDVTNTLEMELALAKNGIPFESHIYSYGGHGFSTAEKWIHGAIISERAPHWVADSIGWLKEIMGELTPKGMTEPNLAVSRNCDTAPVLSVACSLKHLNTQGDEAKRVLKPLYDGIEMFAKAHGYSREALVKAVENNTAFELLSTLGFEEGAIRALDRELHKIVNVL